MALPSYKRFPRKLREITSNHNHNVVCVSCLNSFRTENKLKSHENIYKNYDFCYILENICYIHVINIINIHVITIHKIYQ